MASVIWSGARIAVSTAVRSVLLLLSYRNCGSEAEWLGGHHPELLPQGKPGDPYQHLKVDLHGLFRD
jgi:hypothetical protein